MMKLAEQFPIKLVAWICALFVQMCMETSSLAAPTSFGIEAVVPLGSDDTIVYGANDLGQFVGYFHDVNGSHGFLMSGTSFTAIDILGSEATEVYGINNFGVAVGTYVLGGKLHGFKWQAGIVSEISIPFAISVQPFGINDSGEVVGSYQSAPGSSHGFKITGGFVHTIDAPGAAFTQPYGISNTGVISGNYVEPSIPAVMRTHGFELSINQFSVFDAPGSSLGPNVYTNAHGLNEKGEIVGNMVDGAGEHVFVMTSSEIELLDIPGALCVRGFDISNTGQIVGAYGNCSSPGWIGFVATPISDTHQVSESSSIFLVLVGLFGIGIPRIIPGNRSRAKGVEPKPRFSRTYLRQVGHARRYASV